VVDGWRLACAAARTALEASALDHSGDKAAFREDLLAIARTTLASKLLTHEKDFFAELAVDSVMRVAEGGSLDAIQVLKMPGGSLKDSYLEEGFVLNKRIGVGQPHRIEGAKIMVANTAMDTDKIKIFGSKVRVDSLDKVAAIEAAEREKMRAKVARIVDHGINVFINRQLIYNFAEELFADAGVMAIEHADFDGVERLAAVSGAEICSTFDHPDATTLGEADVVEEIIIGETRMIRFGGVKLGNACTIVLRGASSHVLDEAERSLHDALAVLLETVKTGPIVFGGGASEVLMAAAVDEAAKSIAGKKQMAMESFARALRVLPATVAENAGFDSAELISQVRAAHAAGESRAGIDVRTGISGNMQELGIVEALKLKLHVLLSASEAAEMVIRCDDIVKAAPRAPSNPHPHM
jgi:T-complex protein 1 subunit beta